MPKITDKRRLLRREPHKRPGVDMLIIGGLIMLVLGGLVYTSWSRQNRNALPPPPEDALYKRPDVPIDDRVGDLLSRMTLEEKIGQMALVDKNSLRRVNDISKYKLGAVLSGAGAKPKDNTPDGWRAMIDAYQREASKSRLGIPLLYGLDAIHGHSNVPGATVFPHFIGLGATGNEQLVKQVAAATAAELAATHVNWSFSPTLDAPRDIRWGRVYEAFSDNPELNAKLGAAYIAGLQYNPHHANEIQVLGTAKHYVGVGAMEWGASDNENFLIDQGITPAREEALNKEYLPPFAAASKEGVASVMVGLNKWGDGSVITNKQLITDKLKGESGFEGFVVSDWYGVYERAGNKYKATVRAVNAGLDMAMLPYDYKLFSTDMSKAVERGDISEERVDDAVRRILRQKFKAGLFDRPTQTAEQNSLGSPEHRMVARTAVAQSAVLLKNNNGVLPITSTVKHINVAGSGADNVGRQCGAWTVEWQGIDGNNLPGSTSILQAIRDQAGADVNVSYNTDGDFPGQADVGIAVVSEKPYAEGWGDNPKPAIDQSDLEVIKKLKNSSKRVIVIILSGRPLLLDNEVSNWDGLVAAWLPGSEGGGVADVLFGNRLFSGRLPLPWPASIKQVPITYDGKTADGTPVLFPRGYGLSTP